MDMTLTRFRKDVGGIFSYLKDQNGNQIGVTLEHAYGDPPEPKIPNGKWLCQRGTHELAVGPPFNTFEVTGIEGHTGLLFHRGNVDEDSEGCILVGNALGQLGDEEAVMGSALAFLNFLSRQEGVNEFWLTVE